MNGNKDTHPTYGMMQFSRTQRSGSTTLFGSSIVHSNTVKMCLREASVERSLSSDFYYAGDTIAEVEMSQSQFAELITSMNCGSGVPVTIRWLKGVGNTGDCPFIHKREQFEEELSQNLKQSNEKADELIAKVQELFSKGSALTKADKAAVMDMLTKLKHEVGCNREFIYKSFNEQMDKTVMEAKGEIEAFMQNKVNSLASLVAKEGDPETPEIDCPVDISNKE